MKKPVVKRLIILTLILALIIIVPNSVHANFQGKYHLKGWTAGVSGDTATITFSYVGSDGIDTLAYMPIPRSLFNGHENDPSWTGYNSAAPILAYIKLNGIDNNIREVMNATTYEPTVLQALEKQGVTLKQLGGPANPQVGEATYNDNVNKVVVGIGIPVPDLAPFLGTTKQDPIPAETKPTPVKQPVQQPEPKPVSTPQQNTSVTEPEKSTNETPTTEEPKVGTELNPVPEPIMEPNESQPDPERLNPPANELDTKIPTPVEPTPEEDTYEPSILAIGGISISFILLIILAVFIWRRKRNNNSV